MLDHKSSVAPGKGPAAGHAATPGKQTLTQGMSAKPKAPAPPTASAAKPAGKDSGKGKGKPKGKSKGAHTMGRDYQVWVHEMVVLTNPAQILDLDPDGTAAGTDAVIAEGKRGQVMCEIVDGPIQIELSEPDPETGQLRRVWISRDDAALVESDGSDAMSHDPQIESSLADAGTEKTVAATKAIVDVGQVDSLGGPFCEHVGKLVEAVVPDLGDSSKLVLSGRMLTATGALVYFSFTGSVERDNMIDDDQYKIRLEFGLGFEAKVEGWLVDAFTKAGVFGFVESSGDTGTETLNLLMYALWRSVAAIHEGAADWMFGKTAKNVAKTMDREDYAQVGVGGRAASGLKAGGAEVSGSIEGSLSARYTGQGAKGHETGEPTGEAIAMAQVGLNYSSGDGTQFAGGAAFTGSLSKMAMSSINASATASKTFNLADVKDLVGFERGANVIAAYGLDTLRAMGPVITEGTAKIVHALGLDEHNVKTSENDINKHLLRTAADLSGARLLPVLGGTMLAQHLAKQTAMTMDLAMPMTYEVGVEFEWKPGIGVSLSIQLKRVSSIEIGKEDAPGVFAKIENATRIFKLAYNNQSWSAE